MHRGVQVVSVCVGRVTHRGWCWHKLLMSNLCRHGVCVLGGWPTEGGADMNWWCPTFADLVCVGGGGEGETHKGWCWCKLVMSNLCRLGGGQEHGPQPAALQPGHQQQPHAAVSHVLPGAHPAPGATVRHQPAAEQRCADLPVPQQLTDPALPAGAAAQVGGPDRGACKCLSPCRVCHLSHPRRCYLVMQ